MLLEQTQICAGFVPVDMSAAANNGDWVNTKYYGRCTVVFFKAAAGSGTEDPTLTIKQATSAAGGSAKALNFTKAWKKEAADLQTVDQFTKVTQSAGNTFTSSSSAQKQAIWAVEFETNELDVDGGFTFIQASVADVGTVAQLGCCLYLLSEPRYPDAADKNLTALS